MLFFYCSEYADVAQSVVRRIGSAEVTGPIPVISSFAAEAWLVKLPLIFNREGLEKGVLHGKWVNSGISRN